MDRRGFLKIFSIGALAAISGQLVHRWRGPDQIVAYEDMDTSMSEMANSIKLMSSPPPSSRNYLDAFLSKHQVQNRPYPSVMATSQSPDLAEYLAKMSQFERYHTNDAYVEKNRYPVLVSAFRRLDRVQSLVGHGNFNVISFDETLRYGKHYSNVGAFTAQENEFFEELFATNARQYGFLGEKVIDKMTVQIPKKDFKKISQTGHVLYRGESENLYGKLRHDLGDSIVLTSGIRNIVKQTYLFLAKTIQSEGNLSKASRSLAPPGHSYHGVGDFDVGKVGFGRKNFTESFAKTDEFKKLVDLGYVDIRYPLGNLLGVRYEPWHIKVV